MKIETIEDLAGFAALKDEWNELLRASASDCVFLTWEWLSTWWRHLADDRRLRIITVRDGRELIAIAPLAVRPPKLTRVLPFPVLEFLGAGIIGSDYLDFIIRNGKEQEAGRALVDRLSRETLMLELTQLHRKSCLAVEVAARLGRCAWSLVETQSNVCPFITLAGHSWPSYLAALGPRHRQNFARRTRSLEKQFDVRFERVHSEGQRCEALPHLVALHNLCWKDRGVSEAFYSRALLAFHDEWSRLALERGWLRLFVLWLAGRPAASLYGFRYGRVFYYFQSGFNPLYARHSVGLVAMGLSIKNAIEEGAQEYDLLHGAEPYKFRWAHETRALGRLELYPPGARGRLYHAAVGASRAARRLARRVLPQALADRIAVGKRMGGGGGLHAA